MSNHSTLPRHRKQTHSYTWNAHNTLRPFLFSGCDATDVSAINGSPFGFMHYFLDRPSAKRMDIFEKCRASALNTSAVTTETSVRYCYPAFTDGVSRSPDFHYVLLISYVPRTHLDTIQTQRWHVDLSVKIQPESVANLSYTEAFFTFDRSASHVKYLHRITSRENVTIAMHEMLTKPCHLTARLGVARALLCLQTKSFRMCEECKSTIDKYGVCSCSSWERPSGYDSSEELERHFSSSEIGTTWGENADLYLQSLVWSDVEANHTFDHEIDAVSHIDNMEVEDEVVEPLKQNVSTLPSRKRSHIG